MRQRVTTIAAARKRKAIQSAMPTEVHRIKLQGDLLRAENSEIKARLTAIDHKHPIDEDLFDRIVNRGCLQACAILDHGRGRRPLRLDTVEGVDLPVRTPKRNRRDPTGRDELIRRIDRGQDFCPVPRILRSGDIKCVSGLEKRP
jgi:hypothetical protein